MAIAVLAGLTSARPADAEDLLIIANASVKVATPLSLSQCAAIYLLRMTYWPDGTHVVPVNREATSAVRARFTSEVLRQDSHTLAVYWNQMHYKGKLPPTVQESQQAVLAFVRNVPGAVGYITASTVPDDVKVLARVP